MHRRTLRRVYRRSVPDLETALSGAVSRGEITAVFQPQFDLATHQLVGAEALCRWTHPELGPVSPTEFIAAAEDAGLIDEIGRFMAERCCEMLTDWRLDISVNVSPYQLETPEFTEWLAECLASHRLRGGTLTLEITESRPIADIAPVLRRLEPLRRVGVGVALDDFGAGHASLTQLKRLHGTEVKLDRSLVADRSEAASQRMAQAIALAHRSGIRVVAEGIETADDLRRARDLGCDRGQGYLLGRPMPRKHLETLLRAG